MSENNNHVDHKDNTGMIIAIIVIAILAVGLIAYFAMNGTNEVKDTIDDTGKTIENVTDNDNDQKVAGSYKATFSSGAATSGEEAEDPTEASYHIELVLNKDNTAKLVDTSISDTIITGTYNVNDKTITFTNANTLNDENKDDTTTNASNDATTNTKTHTYQFVINDDNTLTYNSGNQTITLSKVKNNTLEYIK